MALGLFFLSFFFFFSFLYVEGFLFLNLLFFRLSTTNRVSLPVPAILDTNPEMQDVASTLGYISYL